MKAARFFVCVLAAVMVAFLVWIASSWFVHSRMPGQANPAEEPTHKVEIVGIGAVLRVDEQSSALVVVHVFPNTPAHKKGISAGLLVNKIDGTPTGKVPLADCVKRISGPVGSPVLLELIDPQKETTNTVRIMREKYTFEDRGPE